MYSYNIFSMYFYNIFVKKPTASGVPRQSVTHPSTDQTQRCLTAMIGQELVLSTWYGRWHEWTSILWGDETIQITVHDSYV